VPHDQSKTKEDISAMVNEWIENNFTFVDEVAKAELVNLLTDYINEKH
jgi:hypothetical protein